MSAADERRRLEAELLEVAHEAAEAAAGELRRRFRHPIAGIRSKSSPTDLVSDADTAAEAAIRQVLARRRPEDSILGEEGGETGDGERRWVVDPLDGTINFLFGVPAYAVSVACEDRDGGIVGVVLDPSQGETFAATRSGPATLDGQPIEGSERAELATALVGTGFSYDSGVRARQAEILTRVLPAVRDVRRAGAAALDLSWTGCGRLDAYFERGLHAWDMAAGVLIAERAGMLVHRLPATPVLPAGVVVGPPALVPALLALGL